MSEEQEPPQVTARLAIELEKRQWECLQDLVSKSRHDLNVAFEAMDHKIDAEIMREWSAFITKEYIPGKALYDLTTKVYLSEQEGEKSDVEPAPPPVQKFEAPMRGERFLDLILSRESADGIIISLAEGAERRAKQYGHAHARRWYWKEVVRITWNEVKEIVTAGALYAIKRYISGG